MPDDPDLRRSPALSSARVESVEVLSPESSSDPVVSEIPRPASRVLNLPPLSDKLRNSRHYPWALIQLDYCAGVIPITGILAKWKPLSRERLLTVAKEHGWVRRTLTSEDLYGKRVYGMLPHAPGTNSPTDDEIRKAAIVQSQQVIGTHRRDIARARAAYSVLMERFLMAMGGNPEILRDEDGNEILTEEGEPIYLPYIGGRESPADMLNKLSASLVRIIGLERQAYGMEVLGVVDPDAPIPDSTSNESDELARLEAKLDAINNLKAERPPERSASMDSATREIEPPAWPPKGSNQSSGL